MMKSTFFLLCSIPAFLLAGQGYAADIAGKWRRHVITITNTSYSGNPFELPVTARFTHTGTDSIIDLPGYYAGDDKWKIGFMPTLEGEWTYLTSSIDPELDDVEGRVDCVASGLAGMLKADPDNPRKWKFTDGGFVVPIELRLEFFSEPGDVRDFDAVTEFMAANNLHMLETRLLEETGQFSGRHDFIFDGDWRAHQFDLAVWDRMEARMDALTARGLGAHIMFYSDSPGTPSWAGRSKTEQLVIRYAIARLAGYPVVNFNTGIDIVEYRDQAWVDWFGEQVHRLDPYDHPVSSRYGEGSGNLIMAGQTFDSRAAQFAKISDMASYFRTASVPVSMDDAWGENRPSHSFKSFRPEDIRRAFWKAVMAGGLSGLIRGTDGYFHIRSLAVDIESEQWLKLINPFINDRLGSTFGAMVPQPDLVANGFCLADPRMTRIIYYLPGTGDRWDSESSGEITLILSEVGGQYDAVWFDPRTAAVHSVGRLTGGSDHVLEPPDSDDWVLVLNKLAGSG